MPRKNSNLLFNSIAPIYGLFYSWQKRRFVRVIDDAKELLDLTSYHSVLDVGCGTGALCSVLSENGLIVTGIDPAEKMLQIARKKPGNTNIQFIHASVLLSIPCEDKHFDISIASYVAHGMKQEERFRMYKEMSRVTKHKVIIYDYNEKRSALTTFVEWMERGDYFHFIKHAESEMGDCIQGMEKCFSHVERLNIDNRAAWYVCSPK